MDLRGRGRSGRDPTAQSYTLDVYADDMVQLCDALKLERAVWIGTSLGGLVSMRVGASAPHLVAGIVLNDIGPELEPEGLARIQSYAGHQGPVATWPEAVAQVRAVSEDQTPGLSDEEWLDQAHQRDRELPDGRIVPDYDPAIVSGPPSELDPWWVFERLADIPLLAAGRVLGPPECRDGANHGSHASADAGGRSPPARSCPAAERARRRRRRRRLPRRRRPAVTHG